MQVQGQKNYSVKSKLLLAEKIGDGEKIFFQYLNRFDKSYLFDKKNRGGDATKIFWKERLLIYIK